MNSPLLRLMTGQRGCCLLSEIPRSCYSRANACDWTSELERRFNTFCHVSSLDYGTCDKPTNPLRPALCRIEIPWTSVRKLRFSWPIWSSAANTLQHFTRNIKCLWVSINNIKLICQAAWEKPRKYFIFYRHRWSVEIFSVAWVSQHLLRA